MMCAQAGQKEIEDRVRELAPRVKSMAYHMMGSLPRSVEIDDLIQSGMLGLLDAARRYESTEGARFDTYAVQRIRGAMLDGLRNDDWVPRRVRRSMREVEAEISRLEQHNGRPATETEIADALDMDLADYQRLLQDARGYQIVSYEDFNTDEEDSFLDRHGVEFAADPLEMLQERSVREALIAGIDALPEREKLVLALYYDEELKQREIAEVLGLTEGRVCQILTQAIARLRIRLHKAKIV